MIINPNTLEGNLKLYAISSTIKYMYIFTFEKSKDAIHVFYEQKNDNPNEY